MTAKLNGINFLSEKNHSKKGRHTVNRPQQNRVARELIKIFLI
jgi:hypothetical protein